MTDRTQLSLTLDALLQPERFRDYGPNGLQVEGALQVRSIVTGVTASLALLEAAVKASPSAAFKSNKATLTPWLAKRRAVAARL